MKKLGRNLGALLGDSLPTEILQQTQSSVYQELPVEQLQPGHYQPRKHITPDSLNELTESIKSQGVIQPLVVKKLEDNRFEIIAGERRWRASKQAGLRKVPVIIHTELSDQQAIAMALIENIQREDLNVIEEAGALQRLVDECQMTHEQIAKAVGRSRTAVSNLLRLLTLCVEVRELLEQGEIEMGHARALLPLGHSSQREVADYIIKHRLTVRKTEAFVRQIQKGTIEKHDKQESPEVARYQQLFGSCLSTPVKINHSDAGGGRLVISYHSVKHLEKILHLIQSAVGEETEVM